MQMLSKLVFRRALVLLLPALGLVSLLNGQAPAKPDAARWTGKVLTVNGPIQPTALGKTLTYEHVFANFDNAHRRPPAEATRLAVYNQPLTIGILGAVLMGYPNRDNFYLEDERTAASELMHYKMAGGEALVEVTSIGLGRDADALRRVANATGLHVIMGSGWYGEDWYPQEISQKSIEDLSRRILEDVTAGVGDAGIRAGIIGAIATEGSPLTANEVKVIRAAGRASRLSGAAISVRTASDRQISEQPRILDLLKDEGTDLRRVIIGQCDYVVKDVPFLRRLLHRGVYVQFDRLSEFSPMLRRTVTDAQVAKGIVQLIREGYVKQILLSQGVDGKIALKTYGGRGYSSVLELFVPHLQRNGVTEDQIHTILVENPKNVLTFVSPRS